MCSTKKNTSTTRFYHSVNTKYNIYFNANESYKEALKLKEEGYQDTLSQIIDIYPISPMKTLSTIHEPVNYGGSPFSRSEVESSKNPLKSLQTGFNSLQNSLDFNQSGSSSDYQSSGGGSFSRTIEKNTKAIKLHSIKARPERNPAKKRDPKYQAWLQQQEFNPYLKNAWLLLGKAEYQDADYLKAASTFAYIIRLYKSDPDIVAEARLWMIKSNIAMGWYYEAEDIFNQIRLAGGVSENLKHDYNKIYADFLIKKNEYKQAIPYLEAAIANESGGLQKTRMKYLLGQLYKHEGNKEKAYKAFDNVHGLSTPYLYSFNARIEQASFVDSSNKQQTLSMLNKMSKDHKNKSYLDQIYYAIGNIYLNDQDTIKAEEYYKKSIKQSVRNGYDKALTDLVLGDIYFRQKKYIEAQPLYSEALELLSKKNDNYPLVALRSEVLDELVVYSKAIHLQDSLQTLARMPEAERLVVVDKIIEELKKKEKEEKRISDREALIAQREENLGIGSNSLFEQQSPNIPAGPIVTGGESGFYFYNSQTVAQGRAAFQRKWGMRKNEDNWRRRNKQTLSFEENTQSADDTINNEAEDVLPGAKNALEDIYSPSFYLEQIPVTPEAIEASNIIIEDALFNIGKIYKDKLQDYNLAIEAFNADLQRFTDTPNREEIYYQLFLIYLRLMDMNMADIYRNNILSSFPKSVYATALLDSNYASNMLNMSQIEDEMYQQTYELYLAGKVNNVRANYEMMRQKYPLSNLMPKFKFLDVLSYAQTNNAKQFISGLKELITDYPKSDVTPLATELLKGIMSGKELSSDNAPFRGMIWDIKFGGDSINETIGVDFVANAETEYMLLFVFKPNIVDKNQLIYEVANYNFSNFTYQTFDLGFSKTAAIEMLQVKGFKNLKDIISYIDKAFLKNSLMSELDVSIIPIPISADNYIALMNGKTLNEYFLFLEKNYTKEMVTLIRYWNEQRGKMQEKIEQPKQDVTKVDDANIEQVQEVSPKEYTLDDSNTTNATPTVPQAIPSSNLLPKIESTQPDSINMGYGFDDIMSDSQIDKADNIINKTVDVISNPVDGLKSLFKKDGQEKTKEEKQTEKIAKRLKKEQEKQKKAEEKIKMKELKQIEKMLQDSILNIDKKRIESQENLEQSRVEELKTKENYKKDLRKQKEQELKDKEKARKAELKRREDERKARLQLREKERKERLKQREQELKERERKRKVKN